MCNQWKFKAWSKNSQKIFENTDMSRHFNHAVRIEHLRLGVNIPGSRGPGNLGQGLGPWLIIKSRTGTGTQNQYLRDWGPGLKSENPGSVTWGLEIMTSGIRDWERDSDLWDAEFRDSTIRDCPGTKDRNINSFCLQGQLPPFSRVLGPFHSFFTLIILLFLLAKLELWTH